MLPSGLERYFDSTQLKKLSCTRIGIAGVGGLGSNCAMLLARSGITNFVLIDDDKVDASNLNRQHYFPRHVGQYKVCALAESLLELNPNIKIEHFIERIDAYNVNKFLILADYWVEALDEAPSKRLFVEHTLEKSLFTVSASGICGFGGSPMQQKKLANLVLVGDFSSDMALLPPLAPRVMQAAAMQADAILAHILQ